MAANDLTEFMKGKTVERFAPHPYYSKEGDFLTYYFVDEDFYAQRIDDTLTVYLSMVENEFVGFKLKSIRNLLATVGDFSFQLTDDDGSIMLGMLFWAGMQRTENYAAIEYYQKGAERTKHIPIKPNEMASCEA
jgi:hypothetical protein